MDLDRILSSLQQKHFGADMAERLELVLLALSGIAFEANSLLSSVVSALVYKLSAWYTQQS